MPTEAELLRDLRVMYGIAPPESATFENYIDRNNKPTPGGNEAYVAKFPTVQSKASLDAAKNRGLLESIFSGLRTSTLDEGTRELNSRFTDTLRRTNAGLASRGLGGGSAGRSAQSRTLSDLLLGRQRLASAADAADQSSRQSLDEQRQETERAIKLGAQPDITSLNALRQAQTGVNQAYNGLTQQALGGLFQRAGDIYRDTNEADAYGRRGFGSLSPSTSRSSSTAGTYSR